MRPLLILLLGLTSAHTALSQARDVEFPKGAVILEKRTLPLANKRSRTLVLWMLNPKKNPNGYKPDDIYTCPDYTRGSYYSGPTRVSLVDAATGKVINTLNIQMDSEEDGGANVDVPYAIRKGYYYRVDSRTRAGVEVKPTIMWLRDYNGDGKALEFAMFDAPACMGLATTLIGYSGKQDRVIQYPLIVRRSDKKSDEKIFWVDYLFTKQPVQPGHWKYEIDYRGRAGQLEKWDIRYNAAKEQFEGSFTSVPDQRQ